MAGTVFSLKLFVEWRRSRSVGPDRAEPPCVPELRSRPSPVGVQHKQSGGVSASHRPHNVKLRMPLTHVKSSFASALSQCEGCGILLTSVDMSEPLPVLSLSEPAPADGDGERLPDRLRTCGRLLPPPRRFLQAAEGQLDAGETARVCK